MKESALEKIIRESGREPIICSCPICQSQCMRTPCLGTPEDILKLIEAGFADKLTPTEWATGLFLGKLGFAVKMIQIRRTEHGCVFFKDGLCVLHDLNLKPTEGRLSHHTIKAENFNFDKSLTWQVAQTWLEEENRYDILKVLIKYCHAQWIALRF